MKSTILPLAPSFLLAYAAVLVSCDKPEQQILADARQKEREETAKDVPLLPVSVGDQWTYEVRTEVPAREGKPAIDTTFQRVRSYIGKIVPYGEQPPVDCFEVKSPDTPIEREFVEISPEKILIRGQAKITEPAEKPVWFDPAVLFVFAGMKPGTAGKELKSPNGTMSRKTEIVAREEITVSAGKFLCIRLLITGHDGPIELHRKIWFSPGNGIIREEKARYADGKMLYRETQELSALKRAK